MEIRLSSISASSIQLPIEWNGKTQDVIFRGIFFSSHSGRHTNECKIFWMNACRINRLVIVARWYNLKLYHNVKIIMNDFWLTDTHIWNNWMYSNLWIQLVYEKQIKNNSRARGFQFLKCVLWKRPNSIRK